MRIGKVFAVKIKSAPTEFPLNFELSPEYAADDLNGMSVFAQLHH